MTIYVTSLKPNSDDPDFKYIEATVFFHHDDGGPCFSAEVTVFLPKSSAPLAEIEALAIAKAREFLSKAATSR